MTAVFGFEYADAYDHLYSDKDYNQECELIDRLLRTYGDNSVRSLLDLGCGTGNHALPLAQKGYRVLGVDRSNDMLDAARNHDRNRVDEYRKLLELVAGRSEGLEAFARAQIAAEERHLAELTVEQAREDDA